MVITMDQNSVESRSGDAMSIFAQSIEVRRPARSRRRAAHKVLSPEIAQPAKPGTERRHQRRAVVERERARAESELSRAATMAKDLERQIDQSKAKASSSHRPGFQVTRAVGGGRRKKGHADAQAPGGDQNQTLLPSDAVYAEVMQELDRVKRELRKLQREVKSAREAVAKAERDAEDTPTSSVMTSSDSRVPGSGVKREAGGEANAERVVAEIAETGGETEERGVAEIAEAGGRGKGELTRHATWTRAKAVIHADTSHASETTETFATASSTDVEDERSAALTTVQHREEQDATLKAAAAAELDSARAELASVKEEGLQFANAIERTREEMARVAEEIARITEQEKKAAAQLRQLNAKLLRARSRLDAATAEDEKAEAALAELASALQQVGEETEAAEKEKALTETEARCVGEEVEKVGAEVAAAERRVRRAVKELEAARAAEAVAAARLKAAVDDAVMARADSSSSSSENVTVDRVEFEYLTGRVEVVRAAAEKKVAAAEAWVEALQAGEREIAMRAETIEKEIGEAMLAAGEAEDTSASQQQLALRRREAAPGRALVARKPLPPSFDIVRQGKTRRVPACLKVIAGKCGGHS